MEKPEIKITTKEFVISQEYTPVNQVCIGYPPSTASVKLEVYYLNEIFTIKPIDNNKSFVFSNSSDPNMCKAVAECILKAIEIAKEELNK